MIQLVSLLLAGSAVGFGSWSSGVSDSVGDRGTGSVEEDRAEVHVGGGLDQGAGLGGGRAGKADHHVAAGLGADFRFGNAGAVNALADDRHRLVELFLVDVRTALNLGRQDHLGAAFEVQCQLGCPAGLSGNGAASQDSSQHGEDYAEPDQYPEA